MNIIDIRKSGIIDTLIGDTDIRSLSFIEIVEVIEKKMLGYPQLEIPVTHSFIGGCYVREIVIPKGTLLISKYHKRGQTDFMVAGDMSIVTGDGVKRIKAPFISISYPGSKRIGFAHEDTRWIDIRKIEGTNIEELERELYADTYEEMENFNAEEARKDFSSMISEYGYSPETVREQSENTQDQMEISVSSFGLSIRDSKIEGKGVFADAFIRKGEIIAPARLNGLRTQVGRFTNHSPNPNSEMAEYNGDAYIVAKRNIHKEELTVDYRQCLSLKGIKPKEKKRCQE